MENLTEFITFSRLSATLGCWFDSLKEMLDRPARTSVGRKWDEWVMPWIQTRWGANETRTSKIYTNYFWRWLRYFRENQISHPGALTLKHVEDYFAWRAKRRGSQRTVGNRNTAIGEIKFLRMMMDYAVQQGYATENPAKELVLKKEAAKEKNLWEDHEIKLVSDALSQPDKKFGWMHVTFLMGYYQAVRINQCRVPLSRIDFRRHQIDYPGQIAVDGKKANLVKGGKGYVHRIDDEFYPILKEIVAHRRAIGKSTLCDIPLLCGVEYRVFLDGLGLHHLVHHGLRTTWITVAAKAGVHQAIAQKFVHHSNAEVHAIYQKFSVNDQAPMLAGIRRYRDAEAEIHAVLAEASERRN
jgi:hypothetical protein